LRSYVTSAQLGSFENQRSDPDGDPVEFRDETDLPVRVQRQIVNSFICDGHDPLRNHFSRVVINSKAQDRRVHDAEVDAEFVGAESPND
jgi:hypothetical protein